MENQITYTLQQLKNLNDDQIFLELKKIWGYDPSQDTGQSVPLKIV